MCIVRYINNLLNIYRIPTISAIFIFVPNTIFRTFHLHVLMILKMHVLIPLLIHSLIMASSTVSIFTELSIPLSLDDDEVPVIVTAVVIVDDVVVDDDDDVVVKVAKVG